MVNIAIVGDIHLHFSEVDAFYFNQSDYDLILFVGDLSNYTPRVGLMIARQIARIQKPAVFIPGNHDCTTILQLAGEIWQKPRLAQISGWGQKWRVQALEAALDQTVFAGYSTHHFQIAGLDFDVVAARPFSMGGPTFSFQPYLQNRYGIANLDESAERLRQCVDQTQSNRLIFLAHNGPTGLGHAPTDIWGRDFNPAGGDFGDPDLEQAIAYAKEQGKQVLAVIAGHLHHHTKSGQQRLWLVEKDSTKYVNAARVPRVFVSNGDEVRHHVRMTLEDTAVSIKERLVNMLQFAVFSEYDL
ncbi:MAG: metallophosphoesterase [Ardenticatenaceae bacterium]|nr:metallophosphoesterase [Ardenticatenaceae bacterium]MCB9443672.1 metallophosphoesterase [Ardenticatenaceae bacterium]